MTKTKSLRNRFVRTTLLVAGIISISSFVIVAVTNIQTSAEHLGAIRTHIQDGITGKGKVLTQNHALALRSLVVDNAFLDMQQLVSRAVEQNSDVVYGIFVNSQRTTLAYADRTTQATASPPERHVYESLGLGDTDVLVKQESVRQLTMHGEDVLEVSDPVIGEDGEPLGTVRYGLSTRRMREGLASAKTESDARLRRSLLLIGSLVGLTTLLGLLISRVQAERMTRPITDLTNASNSFAAGNRDVRVNVQSSDELAVLGSSFNRMVEDLNRSYGDLELMNQTLEQKVQARTSELALRNRDMRLVLDNVDQGFVTLSPQGVMARETSSVVHQWFGQCPDDMPFADYIGNTSASFGLAFQCAWDQITDDVLPFSVCIDQFPRLLSHADRTWSLRYLPYFRDGQVEGILLVIAEITQSLARGREEAEQLELMATFKGIMQDRSAFISFQREAGRLVDSLSLSATQADAAAVRRALHSLKGNAGMMGLTVVARICHQIEEQMVDNDVPSADLLGDLRARWAVLCTHIAEVTDDAVSQGIEVPVAEYAALVSRVAGGLERSQILAHLTTWQLEPVERPLARLGEQARALAHRLGKGEIDIDVQANGLRLDAHTWAPFFTELVHVIRNAVDHGIESAEERRALSKPERGNLLFKAQATPKFIDFEVGDDGRGIAWDIIAEKAKDRALPGETFDDLLAALCSEGISSKEDVTDVSGRGVGLYALKKCVEALDGKMGVRSTAHVGTVWTFRFPLGNVRAGHFAVDAFASPASQEHRTA